LFISGEFGPFFPNKPVIVPLWLALYLRVRNKCRISPPDFLDSDNIKILVDNEKSMKNSLTPLPDEFFDIAFIFLKE